MSTPEIEVRAHGVARLDEILNPDALAFLGELHRRFNGRRLELLAARAERQKLFDAGATPDFLAETARDPRRRLEGRADPGRPADRRVEITGPVDRKMIVNALNSGAKVFMADFEDASSPVFANMIEGQANLKDLWAGAIDFTDERTGKRYALGPETRGADGAPARLAPRRAPSAGRRRGDLGLAVRFRPLRLPQRQGASGGRARRRLSICRSWRAIAKRGCGTTCSLSPKRRSASPTAPSRRRC